MSVINKNAAFQTVTTVEGSKTEVTHYVYGNNIDHMGKSQLFDAAQAVSAQIAGLKKSNDGVDSLAIQQEIDALTADMQKIRKTLDDKFAKKAETAVEQAAE